MGGAGKDNSKKGAGKGKGKTEGFQPGHTLERTRISEEKFQGTVSAWKGKYGWIKPAEEIPHEKAHLHNGALFVGFEDLEGVDHLEEGATVEFHIWEDSSGLGAEEVEQKSSGKAKGKGKDKGKGKEASTWGAATKGWGAAKGGAKGWSPAAPVVISSFSKGWGKDDKGKGKGKDKGKDKGKRSPGHLLPRERVSAEKFTGTVSGWKGKYGWITPDEPIDHEKAEKHQGKVFAGMDDIIGATELTEGATVEFHVWEDASGLGAEEIEITG